MPIRKWGLKRIVITSFVLMLFFFLLTFVYSSYLIGNSVNKWCAYAQEKYPGDCVESLTVLIDSETENFSSRNSAIWALGQLGDRRALPVLEEYYTGNIPDREPWNEVISQHELKKAIKLAKGSFNATHIFWRNDLP